MPGRARRHLGLLLALSLSAAALLNQRGGQRVGYTRFDLPTYDAYAYATMADEPAFFSVAPWGYRVLEPLLVHLFPPRLRLVAFRDITFWSLILSSGLLFSFLRQLGHPTALSLLGVLAFCVSGPVRLAIGVPILGEPLAVAIEIGALLVVARGGSVPLLAALFAVGVLAKEIFLLMPPLLLLARLPRDGFRRAAVAAFWVALPMCGSYALLRAWWTPGLRLPHAPWTLDTLRAGWFAFSTHLDSTGRALLLSGLLPLAALGALWRESRPYLRIFGYLTLASVALSLLAWINVPSPVPVPLFGANTERILIYALPLLIPLALHAVERVLRLRLAPLAAVPAARSRRFSWLGVGVCLACLVLPPALLDRYRRLPLHEKRDGPLLMAFCRETLRVARRVERGEVVVLDPERLQFAWGEHDPGRLFDMRWFLREGWGSLPHYSLGDVVSREPRTTLVLPCLRPRELLVTLRLESRTPGRLRVFVGERLLGSVRTGPGAEEATVRVPAEALFRGDNLLALVAAQGEPRGVRLRGYEIRAAS